MHALPSIVKGQNLQDEDETTTHIFIVADAQSETEILSVARQWVAAGVLEPALWLPASWLPTQDDNVTDPRALIFGRGFEPESREVSLLQTLAREPHTRVVVTLINSVVEGQAKEIEVRLNALLKTLIFSAPSQRRVDQIGVPGTRLRVLNLIFLPGGKPVPGIREHILQPEYSTVESYIVNPEDRPTPISLDVIPRRENDRWAPFIVSSAATVAGCWSSLARPLIEPDAHWVAGNVRVLRTFARVVLVHPLLAETAETTRRLLLGNTCAAASPGIQIDRPQLSVMGSQLLRTRMDKYVDWLVENSGLAYRPIEDFIPPSRRKRGLVEAIREFSEFAGDRLGALPRWIFEMRLAAFSEDATRVIYGERAGIDIDARRDLNRGIDDPHLVDAWDFVAKQREHLEEILDAPTDPPEESDDPTPWIALHQGVALFAEGTGNEFPELQTENGIPYVAERLDDVIPPPDDEFIVDPECDELLGGDGTGQQVSWLDMEGATRLEGLLQRLASAKRRRLFKLRDSYLATEGEFFSTLEDFLEARFEHEDLVASNRREGRVASVDFVFPGSSRDESAPLVDIALAPVASPPDRPNPSDSLDVERDPASNARRILVWHPHGFEHIGVHVVAPSVAQDQSLQVDHEVQQIDEAPERSVDPFESPLDEHIARPDDLDRLRESLDRAAVAAQRAQRLRGAMNDISADEAERVRQAEHELGVLERTQGELGRWMERRTASFVGRLLKKVRETSLSMDSLVSQVSKSAQEAVPEYGEKSLELQRKFVASVVRGVGITLLVIGFLYLADRFVGSRQLIPGFTGIAWWWFVIALAVILLLVVLVPLLNYFQSWTRERLRADDMLASLKYQASLVAHVKTERLRLAQLHMQVPQRIRALSCWWHFWNTKDEGELVKSLPSLPGCEHLPFHLRWATSNWTHSRAFKQLQDSLISQMAVPGYRSRLIRQATDEWSGPSGRVVPLDIESLARIRSTDALALVEGWRNDPFARAMATKGLEKEIARQAQEMTQSSLVSAPHVNVLNPDPLDGMQVETDLLVDASTRLAPTDDFLLEVSMDAAEMGSRVWAAAISTPRFNSVFAGPKRLRDRLAESVRYVDAESSKVCSSEVAVRIDITDQIQAHQIADVRSSEPDDEDDPDDDGQLNDVVLNRSAPERIDSSYFNTH